MSLFGGRGTRARLRSSIADRIGRLIGFRFSPRARVHVKSHGMHATHVHARVHQRRMRAYVYACMRPHAIRNRVARCTDSTSSIGAPNAEEEEEEAEDRIDSPVTQTRDRATTSLTSASRQESRRASARARRCARKIKLSQSLRPGAAIRRGSKRRIRQYSSILNQESAFSSS